jgi:hypothetical protein
MSLRKRGWDGIRTATLGRPAVASPGTASVFGSTIVSGPGQNLRASRSAAPLGTATRPRSRSEAMWTIRGSFEGLPLAAKILRQAARLVASPARP